MQHPYVLMILGVNPIYLIKVTAFTGDMIHIEEIYVCTGADTGYCSGGPGGTVSDSPTTLIFLVTFSSSCCASSLETQCIDA